MADASLTWAHAGAAVSLLASVLYLVEFLGRVTISRWRKRPAVDRPKFFTRQRIIVTLGVGVPLASFWTPRSVSILLVCLVFLAVIGNEYREWRRPTQSERGTPTSAQTQQLGQIKFTPGESPKPERPLPSRLPAILPVAAAGYLAEAQELEASSEQLIDGAWNRSLRSTRSIGIGLLGDDFVTEVKEWNRRVVDLADKTLSVKQRAQVRSLQGGLIASSVTGFAMRAETVEEIVRDNLATLRMIKGRCGG
jgi:hypothetical protein